VTISQIGLTDSEPVSVLDVTRTSGPAVPPVERQAVGEDEPAANEEHVGRSAGGELAELVGEETIAALAARARAQAAAGGLKLLGSDGLLQGITRRVIEAALEEEVAERLETGRAGGGADAGGRVNERNGRRTKKLVTEVGPVQVAVPRDRNGSFAPRVVVGRQKSVRANDLRGCGRWRVGDDRGSCRFGWFI
jgi:hypothetical protein